ncbi:MULTISPECIES: LysR family transcriptional regulator [unclassified Rhizobium]|jgi:DNA-binding transcriptional LysR family regulator|uniref:LysR family transcriptional regulator n=1 Tax=unclassified Rhizobium TaxID=2613769 RepID=UPI000646ADB4|nr:MULTISPECIES: LysR family transcriptional regulator [unclassified Rhizobium]OJY79653.1 MAG: LysR family transcriptional regulator [Rhizobium sp. 60-20]RKD50708.1 DNA-binding transcriptional LysR family regulator [Rhizobium sp. WW_1]
MSDLLNLNRLIFFTSVIETGSFTAAAERLGVAKAVVSHQVARLEEELGVSLLIRTTRRLHATEEGRVFYDRCAIILREAEAAYGEMALHSSEPNGTLTLTAPLDYGTAVVVAVVAAYRERYPQMLVDLIFDDSVIDLANGQLDLAIRAGWLADMSNKARRLGTFQQYLVATPKLAASFPEAVAPSDVSKLPWIENAVLRQPLRWMFSREGHQSEIVEMHSTVRTDKTPSAYACVKAGMGVSVFPDYMVVDDIAAGRLQRLVPEWTLPVGGIHAVLPIARFRPAKVKRFIEMLQAAERRRGAAAK